MNTTKIVENYNSINEQNYQTLTNSFNTYYETLPEERRAVDKAFVDAAIGAYVDSTASNAVQFANDSVKVGYEIGYDQGVRSGKPEGFVVGGAVGAIGSLMALLLLLNAPGIMTGIKDRIDARRMAKEAAANWKRIQDSNRNAYLAIARSFGKNV